MAVRGRLSLSVFQTSLLWNVAKIGRRARANLIRTSCGAMDLTTCKAFLQHRVAPVQESVRAKVVPEMLLMS